MIEVHSRPGDTLEDLAQAIVVASIAKHPHMAPYAERLYDYWMEQFRGQSADPQTIGVRVMPNIEEREPTKLDYLTYAKAQARAERRAHRKVQMHN